MTTRRSLLCAAALGAIAALPKVAFASTGFPEKHLSLLVPFAPGGAADLFGRAVARTLSGLLGQTVVVENRAGANTAIAARALIQAPEDGHTLLLAAGSTIVLNPLLVKQLPYAPKQDLLLVSLLVDLPLIMVVPTALPVANLEEFARYAAEHDGKLNFASVGVGSTLHLTGELFNQHMGLNLTHVPYSGSAPAMSDLLANRVQVMFDAPSSSVPQIKAGKLKALGVTTRRRVSLLPDVPSISETIPDFETGLWYGIAVRRGTAAEIVERLKAELDTLLADAELTGQLEAEGFIMRQPASHSQIAAFLAAEEAQWSALIQSKDISL